MSPSWGSRLTARTGTDVRESHVLRCSAVGVKVRRVQVCFGFLKNVAQLTGCKLLAVRSVPAFPVTEKIDGIVKRFWVSVSVRSGLAQ